jgi:hypothetical protein
MHNGIVLFFTLFAIFLPSQSLADTKEKQRSIKAGDDTQLMIGIAFKRSTFWQNLANKIRSETALDIEFRRIQFCLHSRNSADWLKVVLIESEANSKAFQALRQIYARQNGIESHDKSMEILPNHQVQELKILLSEKLKIIQNCQN